MQLDDWSTQPRNSAQSRPLPEVSSVLRNNSHSQIDRREILADSTLKRCTRVKMDSKAVKKTEAPSVGASLKEAYLLLYNLACAWGWNFVMFNMGGAFIEGGGVRDAVEASHDVIVVLQLAATMEFVHGCLDLVRERIHCTALRRCVMYAYSTWHNWQSSTNKSYMRGARKLSDYYTRIIEE